MADSSIEKKGETSEPLSPSLLLPSESGILRDLGINLKLSDPPLTPFANNNDFGHWYRQNKGDLIKELEKWEKDLDTQRQRVVVDAQGGKKLIGSYKKDENGDEKLKGSMDSDDGSTFITTAATTLIGSLSPKEKIILYTTSHSLLNNIESDLFRLMDSPSDPAELQKLSRRQRLLIILRLVISQIQPTIEEDTEKFIEKIEPRNLSRFFRRYKGQITVVAVPAVLCVALLVTIGKLLKDDSAFYFEKIGKGLQASIPDFPLNAGEAAAVGLAAIVLITGIAYVALRRSAAKQTDEVIDQNKGVEDHRPLISNIHGSADK